TTLIPKVMTLLAGFNFRCHILVVPMAMMLLAAVMKILLVAMHDNIGTSSVSANIGFKIKQQQKNTFFFSLLFYDRQPHTTIQNNLIIIIITKHNKSPLLLLSVQVLQFCMWFVQVVLPYPSRSCS
ncbi:hypothetical protein P7M41_26670, partial [Vibrio parahaemolyticus]|nr:hypothetical protein [Vibrio parahaemolyticus]